MTEVIIPQCDPSLTLFDFLQFGTDYGELLKEMEKAELFKIIVNTKLGASVKRKDFTGMNQAISRFLASRNYQPIKTLLDAFKLQKWTPGTPFNTEDYIERVICRNPVASELMTLLYLFPNGNRRKDWDFLEVSKNLSLMPEELLRLSALGVIPLTKWKWEYLTANLAFTMEFIKSHPLLPWVYVHIAGRPDVDLDLFVEKVVNVEGKDSGEYLSSLEELSANPSVTLVNILKYSSAIRWNAKGMSRNPGLTLEFKSTIFPSSDSRSSEWDSFYVSSNRGIGLNDIEKTLTTGGWNWEGVSLNPNLRLNFILRNWNFLKDKLDWESVSRNMGISFREIVNNVTGTDGSGIRVAGIPRLPWNMRSLSRRRDIDLNFLLGKGKDLGWDWQELSENEGIPFDFIVAHQDLPWDYQRLSLRRDIDLDFYLATRTQSGDAWIPGKKDWSENRIVSNPSIDLCFIRKNFGHDFDILFSLQYQAAAFSHNPNITVGFVLLYLPQIDFGEAGLSSNQFTKDETVQRKLLAKQIAKDELNRNVLFPQLSQIVGKYMRTESLE